jgi:hypothetical protein
VLHCGAQQPLSLADDESGKEYAHIVQILFAPIEHHISAAIMSAATCVTNGALTKHSPSFPSSCMHTIMRTNTKLATQRECVRGLAR